jgi:3-oxoadipate enol-lactonase
VSIIEIDGVCDINLVRTGPRGGSPIVFLHPVGLDLTWWSAQVEDFGRDHDVVLFDMPNHGLSGKLAEPPSFELMASALEGVLAHLSAGSAHLVGISVGGMIAQVLALRRPDLVRSLSLIATLCTFPEPVREALRERASVARTQGMAKIAQLSNERWFPAAFRERRPDMLDRATKSLLLQDPYFHAAMWGMIAGLDLEARLPEIDCPTLVVAGGEDINAPVAAGEKISGLIKGASLNVMAGLGHFPPFEAPEPFNRLLRRFLAEDEASK